MLTKFVILVAMVAADHNWSAFWSKVENHEITKDIEREMNEISTKARKTAKKLARKIEQEVKKGVE